MKRIEKLASIYDLVVRKMDDDTELPLKLVVDLGPASGDSIEELKRYNWSPDVLAEYLYVNRYIEIPKNNARKVSFFEVFAANLPDNEEAEELHLYSSMTTIADLWKDEDGYSEETTETSTYYFLVHIPQGTSQRESRSVLMDFMEAWYDEQRDPNSPYPYLAALTPLTYEGIVKTTKLIDYIKMEIMEQNLEHLQPYIDQLEELFKRTNHAIFNKEKYLEAQIILNNGLTEDERQAICAYYEASFRSGVIPFVQFVVNQMKRPEEDYSEKKPVNTPVKELLADFLNKKSKRVGVSRKELLRRYEYLDPDDQLTVRLALLQSPNAADNLAGCKLAMERWSGEELPIVLNLWADAQEDDRFFDLWCWSGRLLIRHAEESFLLKYGYFLTHHAANDEDRVLYYYLALRLFGNPAFQLDKSTLAACDYYRVLYHHGKRVSDQEWLEDFYRTVAELYILDIHPHIPAFLRQHKHHTKPLEFLDCDPEIRRQSKGSCFLITMPSIRTILLYGAFLGCTSVLKALDYLHAASDSMIELAKTLEEPDYIRGYHQYPTELPANKLFYPVPEELRRLCPDEYKHLFDEELQAYEAWFQLYIEKEKAEARLNENPVPPEDSYSSVNPLPRKDDDSDPVLPF